MVLAKLYHLHSQLSNNGYSKRRKYAQLLGIWQNHIFVFTSRNYNE